MTRILGAIFVMLLIGCGGEPVGRICDLGIEVDLEDDSSTLIASGSLDCVTRTCLRVPKPDPEDLPPGSAYPTGSSGLCTAECSSDSDCERVPESPCVTGFTCGIAVTVGPSCCLNFCICKDYVMLPPSGQLAAPAACDAANADNGCCNLEGRVGNALYPRCV